MVARLIGEHLFMPIKLGGLLGRKMHLGNDNYAFKTERSAASKQIVSAFRGHVPPQRVLSGAPELAIVRSGRAGGFLVSRFVGLGRNNAAAPGAGGPAAVAGHAAAAAAHAVASSGVQGGLAPAANVPSLAHAMNTARARVADWTNDARAPSGVAERTLRKLPAREALTAAFAAVEREAVSASTPEEKGIVEAARKDLVRIAVRLELGVRVGGREIAAALEAATESVLRVADGLRRDEAGDAAELLPALVSRLASGMASDRASTGLPEDIELALRLIEYGAGRIADSVEWPRDGSALLQMSGRHPALDPFILRAREAAVGKIMARAEELRTGVAEGALSPDAKEAIAVRARNLVAGEAEVVVARRQLEAALAREGIAVDLGTVRLDAAFAQGLRATVKDADKIGMAVAAAILIEQRASESGDRAQFKEDLATAAGSLVRQRDELASDAGFQEVRMRVVSLRRGRDELESRFGDVIRDAARQLSPAARTNPDRVREAQVQAVAPMLRELAGEELDGVISAYVALGGDKTTIDETFARDLLQRMAGAQGQIDGLAADPRLQEYARLGASLRAVDQQREAITPVDEQRGQRLEQFRAADIAGKTALDAAETRLQAAGGESGAPRDLLEQRDALRERYAMAQRNVQAGERDVATLDTAVFKRGGLTADDLKALGLNATETRAALEWSAEFVRRGLWGSGQVSAAAETMSAVGRTLSSGLESALPTGQGNDRLAINLGQMLLANVTGARPGSLQEGLELAAAVVDALPDERVPIEDPYAGSAQAYQRSVLGLLENDKPRLTGAAYLAVSEGLADTSAALNELRQSRKAHQDALARFNATMPAGGRKLDLRNPAGLAISNKLLGAARIIRNYGGLPPRGSLLRENLEAIASDLRGLDPARLTTSRIGGRRLTVEALRDLVAPPSTASAQMRQTSERLMDAARAVVFVREGDAAELRALESEAAERVRTLDTIVDVRAAAMGAEQAAKVRDVIRAAILAEFAATGRPIAEFRPADHAVAINQRLRSWGVDTERFFPEINHQLSESFGATELALWAEQGNVSTRQLLDPAREFIPPGMAGRPRHEPPDRKAAAAQVEALKPGSVMKFFGGSRWDVSVGVSVGAAGAGAKYEQSNISNLEIERGADDYTLVVRAGAERGVALDGSYGLPKNPYANVSAKLEVEYTKSYIAGVRLKFSGDDAGREGIKRVLDKLMAGESITRHDLALAVDVAPASEDKWAVKGTATATAGLKGAPKAAFGADGDPVTGSIGPSMGVRAAISGLYGREVVTESNLNEDAFERATEVALTASVGMTTRAKGEVASGDVAVDDNLGFSLDASAELKFKRIVKGAFDADGRLNGAFIVKNVRAASIIGRIDRMVAGQHFDAHIEDPARAAVKERYQALLRSAEGNDMIRFRFSLKPAVYGQVNALKAQAKAVDERYQKLGERARAGAEGARLRAERADYLEKIDAMLDDETNYEPEKVFHIPFKESATYHVTVPGLVYQRGRFAENQVLWRADVVDLQA